MENLISVIVPVYNVAEYLHQCVDSIINQTYINLEIILVDDGSNDGSEKICDYYSQIDKRVKVVHKKNEGQCVARKIGVNMASGIYIGFVDADDWIEPKMYETLLKCLLETDADFVDSGFQRKNQDEIIFQPFREHYSTINISEENKEDVIFSYLLPKKKFFTHIEVSLCFKLMKKEVVKKAQECISDDLSYGEDGACVLYMIYFSKRIGFSNTYSYHYRRRDNSTSTIFDPIMIIYKNLVYYQELFKFEKYITNRQKYQKIIQYFMTYRIINFLNIGDNKLYDQMQAYILKFFNEKILENKNIIVYGAGKYGQIYYKQFKKNSKINIICWADKNYQKYDNHNIVSPIDILGYDYDVIVIAVKNENIANEIKSELISLGIKESKLLWNQPVNSLNELIHKVFSDSLF